MLDALRAPPMLPREDRAPWRCSMNRQCWGWLVPACVICAGVSFAQTTVTRRSAYTITDLAVNSPFPDDAFAYGISGNGKITGTGTNPSTGELHAFVYENGAFQDLGDLGYLSGSDGDGINDNGQVAATGYGPGYHALIYSNGHATPLGSIDGGSSAGFSINNLGHIVGRAINGDGGGQGFTYIGGQFTALAVDRASCINDSDHYVGSVGYYWIQNGKMLGVEHGFLNAGGVQTDLGSIGGGVRTPTEAYGINSFDEVTGYSTAADGSHHAFLYSQGTLADLGTFPPYYTIGVSINDAGEVAGNITTAYGGQIGAFVYTGGEMHDLSELLGEEGAAWSGLIACHMNNAGWIVGYGTVNGVATHGFLVRPSLPLKTHPR
jgi:probable HAF family extracellular repeat protein